MADKHSWEVFRDYRNNLLAQCDWTQAADSPLSNSKKNEWKTYRQKLRDLPKTADPKLSGAVLDMSSITLPSEPT